MKNFKASLWFTLILFWLLTFALLRASFTLTHGHFGYPLDDTYIHMAMGRHLVEDGFWGVSQNGFSSSTSSPLWTFLIALTYKVLGVNEWTPFALGLLCGSLIIIYCHHLLQKYAGPVKLTIFLVLIIVLTLLPILALTGMEHILHGLLTLGLMYSAAICLSQRGFNSRQWTKVFLLAGLLTLTRYEGLFLVFAIALMAVISKRFLAAFLTAGAGLLPIVLYGIFSVVQGDYFLPNSVLLKGNTPVFSPEGIAGFLRRFSDNLGNAPHILSLMIACLGIYLLCEKLKAVGNKERYLIVLAALMTLLHLQFASVGWFYRYESYLVLSAGVILVELLNSLAAHYSVKVSAIFGFGVVIVFGILIAIPQAPRAARAYQDYPVAVMNIYEQQYQMGLFLNRYYSGSAVAANDIGAINYLADIKTLDLYGLGSKEVTQAKLNGLYNWEVMDALVTKHNVAIVVIYNRWFEGNIPSNWIEIGRWQIAHNVVCGDDVVSFYAPTASQEEGVAASLRAFSSLLPVTVMQSGKYLAP